MRQSMMRTQTLPRLATGLVTAVLFVAATAQADTLTTDEVLEPADQSVAAEAAQNEAPVAKPNAAAAKKPAAQKKAPAEKPAAKADAAGNGNGDEAKESADNGEAKPSDNGAEKSAENGDAKDDDEKKDNGKKPETVEVKAKPLRIEVKLSGVFEALKTHRIAVDPEQWAALEVVEAAEAGATVKKGDVVLQLELEDIDREIEAVEAALELARLELKRAKTELTTTEKAEPLQELAMERARKYLREDLGRFLTVDLPARRKSAEMSLKSSEQYLEYEKEELEQLEKMYEEDDLTEETEEIILKRQRNQVEQLEYMVDRERQQFHETMDIFLPRTEDREKLYAELQELGYQETKITRPLRMATLELTVAKQEFDLERGEERLAELKADREAMTIRAPAAGIVYYGKCTNGQWSGAEQASELLKAGMAIQPKLVLMTIVEPRPLVVRVDVPEDKLHDVSKGMAVTVTPKGFPKMTLDGKIASVQTTPAAGKYAARVSLGKTVDELVAAGMSCSVKLVPYVNKKALLVPETAVDSEPLDPEKKFVHVVDDEGESTKVAIEVGRTKDKEVEIVSGLKAGDDILKEAPDED